MSQRRAKVFGTYVTFERNTRGNKVERWRSVWQDLYADEKEVYIVRNLWEKKGILLTADDMRKKLKKAGALPLFDQKDMAEMAGMI